MRDKTQPFGDRDRLCVVRRVGVGDKGTDSPTIFACTKVRVDARHPERASTGVAKSAIFVSVDVLVEIGMALRTREV